ncbi:MFS transporter [Paenibacillus sp. Marseille-Q4541]|uniref:MFS transporter n=1 Tax=Paenibacillus sp. Marseille-Q4541 TaxID=2831522 RepID=UPI001BA8F062|nr:MFS transporter [Paenibacillus sp. Marseille-Q4541]
MKLKNVWSNHRNYALQLATVFIGFLMFGFSENVKGPAIPRMQADFHIDEMQVGTLLSLNSLGYLIACSFTALLVRRFGIKYISVFSFVFMAFSGILIFLSHNYTSLAWSYFLMYLGNGMLEIALAVLGARIFIKNTGTMMNLAHFFYGLSSTFAPLIASGLMSLTLFGYTLDWRGMYLIILMLSLIPVIPALLSKFSEDQTAEEDRMPFSQLLKDKAAWLVVIILTFGVIAEMGVGGWLVNFLEKAYGWNAQSAAGMLSAFFLCFMLARLLLGPFIDRIGFTLSLVILAGFSGICTLIAIIAGEPGAIFFALAGIGIAPIYPTVMALIARRYAKGSDSAITFTVTLMGIGNVIGNYLIGVIIDGTKNLHADTGSDTALRTGLQFGYGFIGLCTFLCALFSIVLYVYLKKRNELI